ncbi:hypothetical protein A6A04_10550 [Paramagnetospirillum marisnigri]|uniref:WbqC-like protein n=1 Tax=Paramagnetospirillum marisnigri TaxID=1285242 RepID=A0A178MZK6_9PROT|nr:WbqC family protein [Paramagnetospirillum marisnigri]OAN55991.1 hypothetical protein A6A04_10550 [Paramagnetospirillum marisnigri]
MRIAVMQPYFLPYLGYFRLFDVDLFVVYDCVQFPRRGWVHRNQLRSDGGSLSWLTLPLAKSAREASIQSLAFAEGAETAMAERARPFGALRAPRTEASARLAEEVMRPTATPVDYILGLLLRAASGLGLSPAVQRSSSLGLGNELRGQDRILAICKHFGADDYVNAPGGRALYDVERFRGQGVRLRFLSDYRGDFGSILQRLDDHEPRDLRRELADNLVLE